MHETFQALILMPHMLTLSSLLTSGRADIWIYWGRYSHFSNQHPLYPQQLTYLHSVRKERWLPYKNCKSLAPGLNHFHFHLAQTEITVARLELVVQILWVHFNGYIPSRSLNKLGSWRSEHVQRIMVVLFNTLNIAGWSNRNNHSLSHYVPIMHRGSFCCREKEWAF